MQVIFKNKNERSCNREADSVDFVLYARRISRHMKGKYFGRSGDRNLRI